MILQDLKKLGYEKHGNEWVKLASSECKNHVPGAELVIVRIESFRFILHVRDAAGHELMSQEL